jgi:hypothetical protein
MVISMSQLYRYRLIPVRKLCTNEGYMLVALSHTCCRSAGIQFLVVVVSDPRLVSHYWHRGTLIIIHS